jgi:hypothetical protein
MAAVGMMVLGLLALVAAGFCFITGSSWLALALFMTSMGLEAAGFALAGREEAEG